MTNSPLRYKRLIRELPKHKHAQDALIASGFPETTAKHQAKRVIQSAIKHQARDLLERAETGTVKTKQLMSDLVGLSGEELMSTLRKIATQDKDYGSALKVLAPLSREHGVILSTDEDKTQVNVPVLNLSFGGQGGVNGMLQNTAQQSDIIEAPQAQEDSITPQVDG